MAEIRAALANAGAYLTAHPEEAVYTDSLATATLESGLRTRVTGPSGESLLADMPVSVGGGNSAPSAGWLLRAAEAACAATVIAMRAAAEGIRLTQLEVTVDSRSDDRGILGLDPAIPAGPLRGRVHVRIAAAGVAGDRLESIARWGIDHCPVIDAVRRPITMDVEIETATGS